MQKVNFQNISVDNVINPKTNAIFNCPNILRRETITDVEKIIKSLRFQNEFFLLLKNYRSFLRFNYGDFTYTFLNSGVCSCLDKTTGEYVYTSAYYTFYPNKILINHFALQFTDVLEISKLTY